MIFLNGFETGSLCNISKCDITSLNAVCNWQLEDSSCHLSEDDYTVKFHDLAGVHKVIFSIFIHKIISGQLTDGEADTWSLTVRKDHPPSQVFTVFVCLNVAKQTHSNCVAVEQHVFPTLQVHNSWMACDLPRHVRGSAPFEEQILFNIQLQNVLL